MRGVLPIAVGMGLCASGAFADTVNLAFVGSGAGRSVQMKLGSLTQNVFAGQLRHSFTSPVGPAAAQLSGNTLVTFCTDASEYVRSVSSTYTVTPIPDLPVSTGWPSMGAARAQAVYDLYAAAAGSQLGSTADADFAAAFQVLLWEIVYDFNGARTSLDTLNGTMQTRSTSGGALTDAITGYFNTLADTVVAITASQTSLIGLSRLGGQDQIVQVQLIPLPAPVLLGAVGLGTLAVARRRVSR